MLSAVDLQAVRDRLCVVRESRYAQAENPSEWTQDAVAKRAGIEQSVLSKIERIERPMTEVRARVLFAIIQKGLGLTLSEFFRQMEGGLPTEELQGQDHRPSENRADAHETRSKAHDDDTRLTINILAKYALDAQEALIAYINGRPVSAEDLRQARDSRAQEAEHARAGRKRSGRVPRRSAKRRPGK